MPKGKKRAPKKEATPSPAPGKRGSARRAPDAGASRVVSPRDERGTPYKGDFPNPLHRVIRGCF